MVRYLALGFVDAYYVQPQFHFNTVGFEWLRPLSATGMMALFVGVAMAGLSMVWCTVARFGAVVFVLGFGAIFLMDQAYYQNHLYLVLLVGVFFALADVRADRMAATWMVDLLRLQVGVVYVFGGLAKLNSDWMAGQPLTQWMAMRGDWPVIGHLLGLPQTGLVMSWAGLVVDLLIVPLLLSKRTRFSAFILVLVFHAFNALLFKIGVFPITMVLLTTVFLGVGGVRISPVLPISRSHSPPWLMVVVALWMLGQITIPMRPWLVQGNPSWNELGHRFSWRMKLRSKVGRIRFHGLDRERGTHKVIDPSVELSLYQRRKMATRPQLILKYAHHLAEVLKSEGSGVWAIHVDAQASLNGRATQALINPEIDLAAETASEQARWVVPIRP